MPPPAPSAGSRQRLCCRLPGPGCHCTPGTGTHGAFFKTDRRSRGTALRSAAFSGRRKARGPHPRSSAPAAQQPAVTPVRGTRPSSLAGKPCLPSRAACAPQQHHFSPRIRKKRKRLRVREAREPASSQVQGLLLKTRPGQGPRLLPHVPFRAHTGGVQIPKAPPGDKTQREA